MSDLFDRAKAMVTRQYIEQEFGHPKARWMGDNYLTVSPLRKDAHAGSFSIREDGIYYDFVTEESGDIITLLSKMNGSSLKEAAETLLGDTYTPEAPAKPQPEEEEDKPGPKLSWLPIPEGRVPQFGSKPDCLTLYHVDGKGAFYVVRYDPPAPDKKIIYPVFWTGATFTKGLPDDLKRTRPLYRFDPAKTVVIVEGEKKCMEAEKAFPEYAWTCWHGGASNVRKVDYTPLSGCDVVIWGDLDDPGMQAADYLCNRLAPLAGTLRRVVPPLGKNKGWDVGDAINEDFNVLGLLEDSVIIDDRELRVDADTIVDPRPSAARAYTDLGNAEKFCDMWGHILRYNLDKCRWMVWHDGKWKDSDQTIITPLFKRTIRSIAIEGTGNDALFWAKKSESSHAINAMIELAKKEPGVPIKEEDLDRDPYLFNCANGVIDLRTGRLMKAQPDMLCYKSSPTSYDPSATCPLWMKFLDETFDEDPGVLNFIQRWLGYSLTADVGAQTFAVFYGIGANGKSTLVETIQRIVGDYVKTAPPDTFIQKLSGGIPNDVAALRGARMVLTTETEANAKLAEAKVKSMTGGDRVSARYMRGEFFEFTPTWKITISTNHKPRISGGDYGIWRRVVLVPFKNVVPIPKQDPLLPNKLLEEAEGILNWCVKGAVAWYSSRGGRTGLQVPEAILSETQEYREDEDVVNRFLTSACYTHEEIQRKLSRNELIRDGSSATQVFFAFRNWCEKEGENGYAKMTQNMFGRAMSERGHTPERLASGRSYAGVVPKDEYVVAEGRVYPTAQSTGKDILGF